MNQVGVTHNWYMILGSGDEYDTKEYLEQNIRFLSSLPLGYILISILTPFPGTELFNKLKAENRIRHYNWEEYDILHCVYQPLGISHTEIEKLLPKAYVRVYLSKGWRLIPLLIDSMRNSTITPGKLAIAIKTLFITRFLNKDFTKMLKKPD